MTAAGVGINDSRSVRPADRNIWYYVLIALAVCVLFSPGLSFGSKVSGQEVEVRATDFMILFSLMLLAATTIRTGVLPMASSIRTIVAYFSLYFAGVLIYYAVSGSASLSPVAFFGKQTEYFLLCYLAYYAVVKNPSCAGRILRLVVALFLISYFVNALFIAYQVTTGDYHGVARAFERRASVIFETAVGASGQFMILSFLFLLYMRGAAPLLGGRRAPYVLLIVLLFSLAGIGSTSSVISLVMVGAVALAVTRWKIILKSALKFCAALSVAAVPLYFARAHYEHQLDYVMTRIGRVYDLVAGLSLASLGRRDIVWRDTLAFFAQSPVFGSGTSSVPMTDNQYLKMLGEFGVLGFFVFIGVFALLLARYRRIASAAGGDLGGYAGFLFFSTAAILFHGLSADILQPTRIMEPYWLLTGVFWGLYAVEKGRAAQTPGACAQPPAFDGRVHAT